MSDSGALYELGELEVPGLTGPRAVRVLLPPAPPPYPVLYLFDGQNLFGDAGSYSGGWHVHEVMAKLARRGLPTAAVVAMNHGGVHRIGDYSPVSSAEHGPGRADLTLDFVTGPLKALVEREFPVLTGPGSTFIGGSSMGALVSLYGLLRHPDCFGGVLAMSPSLWFGGGEMLQLARERPVDPDARIYLDVGEREMGPWGVFFLAGLGDVFRARGVRRVRVRIDPRGHHREADWRRRLPRALWFLLGPDRGHG